MREGGNEMMKKVLIALCVMAMSSIAIADMTQDFEAMVTSDLYSGGEFRGGSWPSYYTDASSIVSGIGGNTTNMIGFHGYESVEYWAAASEQLTKGSIEFDLYYDTVSTNSLVIRSNTYYNMAQFSMTAGSGDAGIYDLAVQAGYAHGTYSATFVDVFTPGTWYNVEFVFDCGPELTSLYIDGNPLYQNKMTMSQGAGGTINHGNLMYDRHLQYLGGSSDHIYLDDYAVYVPEPATCLLLLGGAALLRRRK
jgi:hypothetical protein